MKRILTLLALALAAVPTARAWTYNDGDVLLTFREAGYNDVEFDIGNVSQFTNLAVGTTITVSGWYDWSQMPSWAGGSFEVASPRSPSRKSAKALGTARARPKRRAQVVKSEAGGT